MPIEYVNVRYGVDRYDVVPRRLLDELIASNQISQFYRDSEQKWVTLGVDPVKGRGGVYNGPDRRLTPRSLQT